MFNYSTIQRVRLESGLSDSINIQDDTIIGYQEQATGIINAAISGRYNISVMLSDQDFKKTDACRVLARVEELLGGGHLLNKYFSTQQGEDPTDGDKKIEDAYRILNDITSGVLKLTNLQYENTGTQSEPVWTVVTGTGIEYETQSVSSAGNIVGFPDDEVGRDFTKRTQR